MANEPQSTFPDYVPFAVVLLIAAHVVALVYWIFKLATEKPPQRRKSL